MGWEDLGHLLVITMAGKDLFQEKNLYNTSPFFLLGVIDSIINNKGFTDREKVKEIREAKEAFYRLTGVI